MPISTKLSSRKANSSSRKSEQRQQAAPQVAQRRLRGARPATWATAAGKMASASRERMSQKNILMTLKKVSPPRLGEEGQQGAGDLFQVVAGADVVQLAADAALVRLVQAAADDDQVAADHAPSAPISTREAMQMTSPVTSPSRRRLPPSRKTDSVHLAAGWPGGR